jgi:hypothetical protein
MARGGDRDGLLLNVNVKLIAVLVIISTILTTGIVSSVIRYGTVVALQ